MDKDLLYLSGKTGFITFFSYTDDRKESLSVTYRLLIILVFRSSFLSDKLLLDVFSDYITDKNLGVTTYEGFNFINLSIDFVTFLSF